MEDFWFPGLYIRSFGIAFCSHSHSTKRVQQTENQQLFLDPSENWNHRAPSAQTGGCRFRPTRSLGQTPPGSHAGRPNCDDKLLVSAPSALPRASHRVSHSWALPPGLAPVSPWSWLGKALTADGEEEPLWNMPKGILRNKRTDSHRHGTVYYRTMYASLINFKISEKWLLLKDVNWPKLMK